MNIVGILLFMIAYAVICLVVVRICRWLLGD